MKSRVIFLFFLFMAFTSSLFAFNNQYFSFTDKGWDVEKQSDAVISLTFKDYTPPEEDDTEIVPFANINVKTEKDTIYVVKFDQKELDDLKNNIKNKAFKDYLEIAKKSSRTYLEKMYPNSSQSKINEALDNIYSNSGITSATITKFGSSRAYCVTFTIAKAIIKRFIIPSLNRITVVEFTYPESFDLDSSKPYKDFLSSFNNKDSAPTSFNGFIYGGMGKNILKILVFLAVGIGGTILKKLKS